MSRLLNLPIEIFMMIMNLVSNEDLGKMRLLSRQLKMDVEYILTKRFKQEHDQLYMLSEFPHLFLARHLDFSKMLFFSTQDISKVLCKIIDHDTMYENNPNVKKIATDMDIENMVVEMINGKNKRLGDYQGMSYIGKCIAQRENLDLLKSFSRMFVDARFSYGEIYCQMARKIIPVKAQLVFHDIICQYRKHTFFMAAISNKNIELISTLLDLGKAVLRKQDCEIGSMTNHFSFVHENPKEKGCTEKMATLIIQHPFFKKTIVLEEIASVFQSFRKQTYYQDKILSVLINTVGELINPFVLTKFFDKIVIKKFFEKIEECEKVPMESRIIAREILSQTDNNKDGWYKPRGYYYSEYIRYFDVKIPFFSAMSARLRIDTFHGEDWDGNKI